MAVLACSSSGGSLGTKCTLGQPPLKDCASCQCASGTWQLVVCPADLPASGDGCLPVGAYCGYVTDTNECGAANCYCQQGGWNCGPTCALDAGLASDTGAGTDTGVASADGPARDGGLSCTLGGACATTSPCEGVEGCTSQCQCLSGTWQEPCPASLPASGDPCTADGAYCGYVTSTNECGAANCYCQHDAWNCGPTCVIDASIPHEASAD
jgi:hypothetical protein